MTCSNCGLQFSETVRFCGRCGARISEDEPAADPLIGRVVDGRYRILARIGQGGMGTVYRVEHVAIGKIAALKVLNPSLSKDMTVVRRFRREAEAVSRLSHPNIVQIFDSGVSDGGMYLVMELLRGEDLGRVLSRDGAMTFKRVAPILIQICEALTEAHERGVVHRDLKPENLMIGRSRNGGDIVKVLDFGLAKLRDRDGKDSGVTERGIVIGTPHYMSPEQIRAQDLDTRSDIYSMGAVMFRMLAGAPPFVGESQVAVLTQHLTDKLPSLSERNPEIPRAVDEIVARAMAKLPRNRFQSAAEFRAALKSANSMVETATLAIVEDRRRVTDVREAVEPNDARLRREDVDEYETGLRRRKWLGLGIPALFLSAGIALAAYKATLPPTPMTIEHEPNNDLNQANNIGNGIAITGRVGVEGIDEADRDVFVFTIDKRPVVFTAALSGIVDLDLKLELLDKNATRIDESDRGRIGQGEEITRVLSPGEYYLVVREVWVEGQTQRGDLTHPYTLKVSWHAQ